MLKGFSVSAAISVMMEIVSSDGQDISIIFIRRSDGCQFE